MQKESLTETAFNFSQYLEDRRQAVEERLKEYLSEADPPVLWESMRYSVLSGGKRLRAILCLSAAEAIAARKNRPRQEVFETVLPCCCAIEMVHAMSLIHDDLPAMDNDDFRRGKPTNHKVFGEAIALLAGDALLMYATDVLLSKTPARIDPQVTLSVARELCRACGPNGLVGGQVYDLAFTGRLEQVLEQEKVRSQGEENRVVELIHRGKTGELIRFSVWSGARLLGASTEELAVLSNFAENLGLAFQIADDLLDVTGDIKSLGKTPGKDVAANKVTWVTVYGEDRSKKRLRELEEAGLAFLDNSILVGAPSTALKRLLRYAIHRSN
jgi:geranylgeranyl diphosphate synthase, type II